MGDSIDTFPSFFPIVILMSLFDHIPYNLPVILPPVILAVVPAHIETPAFSLAVILPPDILIFPPEPIEPIVSSFPSITPPDMLILPLS